MKPEDKKLVCEEILATLHFYNGGGRFNINRDSLAYEIGILMKLKESLERDRCQDSY